MLFPPPYGDEEIITTYMRNIGRYNIEHGIQPGMDIFVGKRSAMVAICCYTVFIVFTESGSKTPADPNTPYPRTKWAMQGATNARQKSLRSPVLSLPKWTVETIGNQLCGNTK